MAIFANARRGFFPASLVQDLVEACAEDTEFGLREVIGSDPQYIVSLVGGQFRQRAGASPRKTSPHRVPAFLFF
jgi:hypothetical protein